MFFSVIMEPRENQEMYLELVCDRTNPKQGEEEGVTFHIALDNFERNSVIWLAAKDDL